MFLLDAKQSLSVRPQTVEEIGEVNQRHTELSRKKPEVCTCVWVWGGGGEEGGGGGGNRSVQQCVCMGGVGVQWSTSPLLPSYEWPRCEAIFLYVELHVPVHVLKLAEQTHR